MKNLLRSQEGALGMILVIGFMAFAVLIATAAVVVAVAAFTLPRPYESVPVVSHVGDHSQMMHMDLLLTEWDVAALNASLNDEMKHGESTLEIHNDGKTVHRLAIWRGGVIRGDQVVGGILVAETDYIRPGELTNLNVDLEPGEYVLVCSIRGHVARGMYATAQVR